MANGEYRPELPLCVRIVSCAAPMCMLSQSRTVTRILQNESQAQDPVVRTRPRRLPTTPTRQQPMDSATAVSLKPNQLYSVDAVRGTLAVAFPTGLQHLHQCVSCSKLYLNLWGRTAKNNPLGSTSSSSTGMRYGDTRSSSA